MKALQLWGGIGAVGRGARTPALGKAHPSWILLAFPSFLEAAEARNLSEVQGWWKPLLMDGGPQHRAELSPLPIVALKEVLLPQLHLLFLLQLLPDPELHFWGELSCGMQRGFLRQDRGDDGARAVPQEPPGLHLPSAPP